MSYSDEYLPPPFDHKLFYEVTLHESEEVSERVIQRLMDLYDRYPSFREVIQQLFETNGQEVA